MSMSFGAYITKDPSGFFDDLMQVIDGSFERKDMVLENGKISIYNVGNNVRVDIIRKNQKIPLPYTAHQTLDEIKEGY